MIMPKLTIVKKFVISRLGHYRYYSPYYNINKPKIKPKALTIDLEGNSDYYNASFIKTEKQLCKFIYDSFGPGEYRVIAHLKGRKGSWTFWKGKIDDLGFSFERREIVNNREITKLSKELNTVESEDEKQIIKEDIEFEKEFALLSKTRYGFAPFLVQAVRRGDMFMWNDAEITSSLNEIKQQDTWGLEEVKNNDSNKLNDTEQIW